MTDKDKLRAETVAMLRAVLISSPRGVPFEKLYRDYKQLTGKTIPYQELGFQRLENFIQDIPDVARAEKEHDGSWTLKGVASDADKHVAKLISKQKKPKVRKSAKHFARRPPQRKMPPRFHSPVKPPPRVSHPPLQQLRKTLNTARQRPNASQNQTLSISLPNTGKASVRSVSVQPASTKPKKPAMQTQKVQTKAVDSNSASVIMKNPAFMKWVQSELDNAPNGLWASRLPTLYDQKFSKILNLSDIMEYLKSTENVVQIEEPIPGKFVLYKIVTRTITQDVPRKVVLKDNEVAQEMKQLTPQSGNKPERSTQAYMDIVLQTQLPQIGSSVAVYVSHVVNPGKFFVHAEDMVTSELNSINAHYEKSKHNPDEIDVIKPGHIFCAQFTEDNNFYRARVLDVVDTKHVQVEYIDFGNCEVISLDRLRILDEKFQTQPIQALQCCLNDIQPQNEENSWSDESFTRFSELICDKELTMTVKDIKDNVLHVTLFEETLKIDIGEKLVHTGLAVPSSDSLPSTPSSSNSSLSSLTGTQAFLNNNKKETTVTKNRSRRIKKDLPGIVEIPEDPFLDVFVCNITGTYNIYLRLVGDEYSLKLERLQESMTSYYNESSDQISGDPEVGEVYALLSDDVWCRVRVVSVHQSSVDVFFLDHGDMINAPTSELRTLVPVFRKLPFQVFECALSGLPKTKNPNVVTPLQKLAMGEVCVAEVVKRHGSLVFIDLIVIDPASSTEISANNILRQLVIPDEELKPTLPKVGDIIDVQVPYISPTGNVYLHVSEAGTERLQELTEDLTQHYSSKRSKANEFISNPTEGKVCCARSDDGNWYRVKIISATDRNAVEVFYVDYGNKDSVISTNLREPTQVNDHVLSLPYQALECQLYDVPKECWNEELANRMMNLLQENSVTAEILLASEPPAVSLLLTISGEKEEDEITERLVRIMGISDLAEYTLQCATTNGDDVYHADESDKKSDDVSDHGEASADPNQEGARDVDKNVDDKNTEDKKVVPAENTRDTEQFPQTMENEEKMIVSRTGEDIGVDVVDQGVVTRRLVKPLHLGSGWLDIFVTTAKDPEHFTFQLLSNLEQFYKMSDSLNQHYQGNQTLEENPSEGGLYAVYHSEHDCWYRAIVETVIKDEKAYVLFVDYGDEGTVDIENIQHLEEEFLSLPFQCVQATSCDIEPNVSSSKNVKAKWSKASQKAFQELVLEKEFVAKVMSDVTEYELGSGPRLVVKLFDTSDGQKDKVISDIMIDEGHALAKHC